MITLNDLDVGQLRELTWAKTLFGGGDFGEEGNLNSEMNLPLLAMAMFVEKIDPFSEDYHAWETLCEALVATLSWEKLCDEHSEVS